MKTHELATALEALASILRSASNQELDSLSINPKKTNVDQSNALPALNMLVALSEFDKNQWITLIKENRFDVAVSPKDSSRNILGRLLKYLESNPEARNVLTRAAQKSRSSTSPELMKALQFLMTVK
ncbi:hypothetical protein E4V01_15665 [Methylorubrum sp. Q1]|uniref:hypothetical protein n=1 Tax=Methylorubrum sp. Q1 TaxID=2562453 RepID=UPI0010763DB2|nr:hypothetical protein [Methylorubrum sp. Q1]TFZ57372.1 hypothetical protein E4V01_15665 [Methylorubrum sp. Q1]